MKLNCRRKWSEITKCQNKCQNFPLTVLQINFGLQCWIPRFSRYNSIPHRQYNSYWPSFKDRENTVFWDHRTHVFIDTPTCHSVRHFFRTHPWLQTDHLTRSFFFLLLSELSVRGKEPLEIYHFLLPSCRICHEQEGWWVIGCDIFTSYERYNNGVAFRIIQIDFFFHLNIDT